jgi:hypothetical protein
MGRASRSNLSSPARAADGSIARSADRPSLTREALAPGASCEAYLLSRRASRINGDLAIDILLALLVIAGVSVSGVLPALGMANAAFLVFMGTFNYAVYPDIFERRAENEALPVASPTIVSRRCRLRRRVVSRWRNPD